MDEIDCGLIQPFCYNIAETARESEVRRPQDTHLQHDCSCDCSHSDRIRSRQELGRQRC